MKQQQQGEKKRQENVWRLITGTAVVDFIGRIRDSAILENMRAFISDYVIVNGYSGPF